jgi:hypothetical protein
MKSLATMEEMEFEKLTAPDPTEMFVNAANSYSGAHPASYPMGTRGSFPGVKQPGREADHSPPSSVEVKEWVALYLRSPIRLHGVVFN